MAVFGNLSELPLSEVLTMVGRGMGRFSISKHPTHKEFALYLRHGRLTALLINSTPVDDVLQVRLWLGELLRSEYGEFEFLRMSSLDMSDTFELPLDQLILSSLSEIVEEQTFLEHFPDPSTVFETTGLGAIWVDPALERFFELGGNHLLAGICATRLADRAELPLDYVLLCLYKLRCAGVITPRRAFIHANAEALEPLGKLVDSPTPELALGNYPPASDIWPSPPEARSRTQFPSFHPIELPMVTPQPSPNLNYLNVDVPNSMAPLPAPSAKEKEFPQPPQPAFGRGILGKLISGIRRTFGQSSQ